jgi:hypothetical protein
MRVGTKQAKEVLAGVLRDFGVSLADLRGKSRSEAICLAKQAFVTRSAELQIPIATMAQVLDVHRHAIMYQLYPAFRERRKREQRRYKAKAKAKREVSTAAIMGAW